MTGTGIDVSTNVVELKYFRPAISASTFGTRDHLQSADSNLSGSYSDDYQIVERSEADHLSAQVLRKLDPDTELAKFFDFAAKALRHLEECEQLLADKDHLAADDKFIASKELFAELLMYRDVSDAVGIIALKCFQAAALVKAITDAPTLPRIMQRALHRVWAAPFMKFEEACRLVDEIESVAEQLSTPALHEVTSELIGDAQAQKNSD